MMKLFFLKYLNSKGGASIMEEDEEDNMGNEARPHQHNCLSTPITNYRDSFNRMKKMNSLLNSSINSPKLFNTSRFWDEEKEDDAIYSVYLKKVRYHPGCISPSGQSTASTISPHDHKSGPFNGEISCNDVSHLQWETVKVKQIKAGTLERLIENLTCQNGDLEQNFATIFLATFRSFTTPRQLLSSLRKRYIKILENQERLYSEETKFNHLRALRSIFSSWLDNYLEDFRDDAGQFGLINELCTFAQSTMNDTELALRSLHKIEKIKLDDIRINELPLFNEPPINLSQNNSYGGSNGKKPLKYSLTKCLDNFDENTIAEQLTYMDSELFKRVIPYECMGCFWAKKNGGYSFISKSLKNGECNGTTKDHPDQIENEGVDKSNRNVSCSSVRATVDFFNFVSYRVMDTILAPNCYLDEPITKNYHFQCGDPWMSRKKSLSCKMTLRMKTTDRVKRIIKWIDVARELRMLKNFSSLKAVISALRSNPIYRLTKVWALVSKDKLALFEELSALCSEENNQLNQRTLLEKEGTAKMVDPKFAGQGKRLKKQVLRYKRSHSDMGTINGTVPYLGTFLTDLTMIDTMYPDHVNPQSRECNGNQDYHNHLADLKSEPNDDLSPGLINFDKRRKEFDIMIQIKILQASANNYSIAVVPDFWAWFKDCHHYVDYMAINPTRVGVKFSTMTNTCGGFKSNQSPEFSLNEDFASLSMENGEVARNTLVYPSLRQTLSHYEKLAYSASIQIQSPIGSPNVTQPYRPEHTSGKSPKSPTNVCNSRSEICLNMNGNYYHGGNHPPSPSFSSKATRSSIRSNGSSSLTNRNCPSLSSYNTSEGLPAEDNSQEQRYIKLLDHDWAFNLTTLSPNGATLNAASATPNNDDSGIDSLNNYYDLNGGTVSNGIFSYASSSRSSFKCSSSLASRDEFPNSGIGNPKSSLPQVIKELSATSSTTLFTSNNGSPNASIQSVFDSPYKSSDLCIIKVSLDKSIDNSLNTTMYKSIWIKNSDKTYHVLAKALEKHGINEDVRNFSLYQIGLKINQTTSPRLLTLTNHIMMQHQDSEKIGYFLLPHEANVFYGMREDCEPNFKIVRKNCQPTPSSSPSPYLDNKKLFYSPPLQNNSHHHKYSSPIKRIFPSAASYFTNAPPISGSNGGCARKIQENSKHYGTQQKLSNLSMDPQVSLNDKMTLSKQKKWKSASLLDVVT